MNRHHWTIILGALLLAAVVGIIAYNAGVAHGEKLPPPAFGGQHGWHHHHHHGGFFFIPLVFLALFLIARRSGGCGLPRRAHEQMSTPSS